MLPLVAGGQTKAIPQELTELLELGSRQKCGSSAAEEERVEFRLLAAVAWQGGSQFKLQGGEVISHQIRSPRDQRKVAVPAAVRAEGHVDIAGTRGWPDSVVFHHSHSPCPRRSIWATSFRSEDSSSRRATSVGCGGMHDQQPFDPERRNQMIVSRFNDAVRGLDPREGAADRVFPC